MDDIVTRVSALASWEAAGGLAVAWLTYKAMQAVYRLTLHPLAKFPGPKTASASYLYEFYFDVVKWGRYSHEIRRLHDIYGPIIRINPDELHCNDPAFMDVIYPTAGKKRNKSIRHIAAWGPNSRNAGFGTIDHAHHRMRRAPLAKFFSKAQVSKLEPQIQLLSQRLCDRILELAGTGRVFDVTDAYSCFTTDVIYEYCFGESLNLLQHDGFEGSFREPTLGVLKQLNITRFFPLLMRAMQSVPLPVLKYVKPDAYTFMIELKMRHPVRIEKVRAEVAAGTAKGPPTLFRSIFESDLPEEEKGTRRLVSEAAALLGAGTETTASTLALLTFYLVSEPDILARVTAELNTVVTDLSALPSWATLEQLPYFSGVIAEGVRLAMGVSFRLPRNAPDEEMVYRGAWTPPGAKKETEVEWVIPRGADIGMSSNIMHRDERVFPDAGAFKPERWLDGEGRRRRDLDRYIFSFGKGSRQCIALNLGYCELHIGLAALVLRVFPHLRLYDTTVEDVRYDHDMLLSVARKGSKGVRAAVGGEPA